MFDRGRLILFFAISIGLISSSDGAAGYRRVPLAYRQLRVAIRPIDTVASKRTRDLVITITNADGRLRGGDNEFCLLFQKRESREAAEVQDVSIDFALLVGRIQREPIRARLTQERQGRFCGHLDLGKQYYIPASYYAFVRYTDADGEKRKERVFLTVK
jgi:hypothetical protein